MIKKFLVLFLLMVGMCFGLSKADEGKKFEEIDSKIDALLAKMSVEEKVGQMTQITLAAISKQAADGKNEHVLDMAKLEEALTKYHIGSFLNVHDMSYSTEYWHKLINTIQKLNMEKSASKIPMLYGIDAIHGATYTLNGTLFPQSIAMAATRNVEFMEKGAEITAIETRASGIPWNFNPVLGMGRQPLWPRFWETFGEDVHLTTEMGKAYIKGSQGDDMSADNRVAACMKHYLGYSIPTNGFDRTPAHISERMIREILLPPFEAAVKEGVLTVMVNSAELNGIPTHSDHFILTELLKEELGFKGFVVSDWEDIKRLHTRDRVAESPEEAVKMAVMAGMDMSMVPMDYSFYNILVKLVKAGEVPMERIDDAVKRILRVKMLVGLFDNPYPKEELKDNFGTEEFTKINLAAATEAITLVKNENNLLPLSKTSKVMIAGPSANKLSLLNGGWTITWQGDREDLYPQEKNTVMEAVTEKVGKENVIYVAEENDKASYLNKVTEAAKKADVVVLCIGESKTYCETMGNIKDLRIDEEQAELVKAANEANKPIVFVMLQGRPRVINEIEPMSTAVLVAMYPGMEGGNAISDILFGDANPSGKLPFSYPANVNGFTTYDHKPIEEYDQNSVVNQWDFGTGLSYTTFEYSDLTIDKDSYALTDDIKVTVKVKNTGKIAGKEAVELYLTDVYGSVTRPVKQLKAFSKILLEPGEDKLVSFTVKSADLSFIGRDNKRIVEPGEYKVAVSDLTKSFIVK